MSISQAWRARLLKARLEERPERLLEIDDPLGVGEGEVALAADQPADELIALVGEEEECELQQEVGPPRGSRRPMAASGPGTRAPIVRLDPAWRPALCQSARQEVGDRGEAGRSIHGQWPRVDLEKRAPGRTTLESRPSATEM